MPPAVPPPGPRALRAGLAATAAVLTAVLAHRLAHGSADAAGALWALAGLVGPAWWLTGRELGWGRLALVQLAGQQVAHLALAATAGTGGDGLLPPDLMVHAHLAAAALTACWLRAGERRAWAALRRVARVVLTRPAPRPLLLPDPVAPEAGPSPVVAALRHCMARRGPPRYA
jgi:hypothetical protein